MVKDVKRVLIETMVRRALKDMESDPERSVRNLVDLALNFAKGRFQKEFLSELHEMFKNEHSAYYPLFQDVVTHVERERLLTFGMNIGYNSCTYGANTIRRIEEKEHYNIPWSMTLEIAHKTLTTSPELYDSLLTQGEELGIYTWFLFIDRNPMELFSLIDCHRNSAFVLFCPPAMIDERLISDTAELNNLMIAVRWEEDTAEACTRLREEKLLYSVYVPYREETMPEIENGNLFDEADEVHPLFTVILPLPGCSPCTIHDRIAELRSSQIYRTIPWDMVGDSCTIDSVISDYVCVAAFDKEGYLHTIGEDMTDESYNIFINPLPDILKRAFPYLEK